MNTPIDANHPKRRRRGIALVTVISLLVILTVLSVAILSIADTERKSSVKYSDGEFARNLSDTAISVVMGQIWEGTKKPTSQRSNIWASQPGAIRKYSINGNFSKGYKLYSDDAMIEAASESNMINDNPDVAWQDKPGKWVDLNEPVIQPDKNGDNLPEVIFPILDPRAFIRGESLSDNSNRPGSSNIEGFSYQTKMGSTAIDWVKDARTIDDVEARLPMPVQWLYMLKDGTLGYVNEATGSKGNEFVGPSGVTATAINPIVGRIAFWTDDETSKLNINTAGEPTGWSPPMAYHDRDYEWAVYQPTRFEYQRYPGHPATVALSTVLFPNQDMDSYGKTGTARDAIIKRKERIYEVMPKINAGGSKAATVPFWAMTDPAYSGTRMYRVDVSESLNERLYASVDELLFSQHVNGKSRLTQDAEPGAGVDLFGDYNKEEKSMERLRFFLTAHSRAPETTIFGTPRVAMWPVANEDSIGTMRGDAAQYRTVFDNLVAFCGTLQASQGVRNSYFFRRADSTSATNDVRLIQRNQQLLDYLYDLMSSPYPSGGGTAASFTDKYRNGDAAQILAEIFDYIRSTNIYDGALAVKKDTLINDSLYKMNGLSTKARLDRRDQLMSATRTFTPSRASDNVDLSYADGGVAKTFKEQVTYAALPGHGQVVPIQATIGGHDTRGFGRFPTISEVGLHFICTADGNNDEGSWKIRNADGSLSTDPADVSGGRTATKLNNKTVARSALEMVETEKINDPIDSNKKITDRWYSNFPPYPGPNKYGTVANVQDTNPRHYSKHPGYLPQNWNMTLVRNQPMPVNTKRIQAMLSFELTVPASGYPGIFPDMCISVEKLTNFTVGGAVGFPMQIFNTPNMTSKRTWRAPSALFQTTHNREAGGSVGPAAFTQSRHVMRNGDLPDDPSYDASVSSAGRTYDGSANFDFVSNSFSIVGDVMKFSGGDLVINVFAGRDMTNEANRVQTFTIKFPQLNNLPVPELVVLSSPRMEWNTGSRVDSVERIEAPRWWAFNYGGAIGRLRHNKNSPWTGTTGEPIPVAATNSTTQDYIDWGLDRGRTLGRFFSQGGSHGSIFGIPRYDSIVWAYGRTEDQYPDTTDAYSDFTAPQRNFLKDAALRPLRTNAEGVAGVLNPDVEGPFGQDVVISMVPKHGDIRLIAAKKFVPESDWEIHPAAADPTFKRNVTLGGSTKRPDTLRPYSAHSFMRFVSNYEPGVDLNDYSSSNVAVNYNKQLVYGARYATHVRPDLPVTSQVDLARRYGDFDAGIPNLRDGPWINKPDEGNTGIEMKADTSSSAGMVRTPTAYFDEMWRGQEAGEAFMSPNRMVSSPGMFGSLSTGVKSGDPWRTLLFRPYVPSGSGGGVEATHPGSPNYTTTGTTANTATTPFRGVNPADHYLMDLFWMPVVEPYAISEPFSTAGKVNINYQMVPFNNYIRRATGLYAVLKGEVMEAYASANAANIQSNPNGSKYVEFGNGYGEYSQRAKWSDIDSRSGGAYHAGGTPTRRFWHRNIDIDSKLTGAFSTNTSTLGQIDDRFSMSTTFPVGARGLFRSASQIAEVHLVPKKVDGSHPASAINASTAPPASDGSDGSASTKYSYRTMGSFWEPRSITGDNLKERPYANIYAKITTKSNTYRVHYRAQSIRKARSGDPNVFDPAVDEVNSDYRGSALIERRIDPEDPRLPDFASGGATGQTLDDYYNFRVLENKRFTP